MKVAVGQRIVDGPWGGGNLFAKSLVARLSELGHEVVFDLQNNDIDIILMLDPRSRNPQVTFTPGDILRYLLFRNEQALVVHRINECDERKGTRTMNFRLRLANFAADHTVFIASWLRELAVWRPDLQRSSSVILNGADTSVFHPRGAAIWKRSEPLRLVTHHWGGNWMKGFDIYRHLDEMLGCPDWQGKVEFTYIGNTPPDFAFRHSTLIEPLSGSALADELRRHHVYVTGSRNEPGGMHHIEGACCGLPLLYRRSGALPEYCSGFGIEFDTVESFEPALSTMLDEYDHWRSRLEAYGHNAEKMVNEFIRLFEELISRRDEAIKIRRPWKQPLAILANQIPL